ncbi:hypothetical protein KAZ92_01615 [Candidatus Gracilibacteria bacterium]|nr:hypothetical protein [Candidatus Gracilibacteria bacterium]
MSKKPNQPPSDDPSRTITPLDGVRADGKIEPSLENKWAVREALKKQRADTSTSVSEIFELPPEALRESTYRIFQPKLEKAKRIVELHAMLENDDEQGMNAFQEINDLLGKPKNIDIENKRLKNAMLDGLAAILILKRTRYISIHDGDNFVALFQLQQILNKTGHTINDNDLDMLFEVFQDVHPIDQMT